MFTVELLPAAHGDALWIEYGTASKPHRILIDGGPASTYDDGLRKRIAKLPEKQRRIDLMVVTHVDTDHIDSSLILLQEVEALKVDIAAVWFNGWTQLTGLDLPAGAYKPLQGEFLGGLIQVNDKLSKAWNAQFKHRAVAVPDTGPLPPPLPLAGGATLTLLGPTKAELRTLRSKWTKATVGFTPGDTKEALRRLAKRHDYKVPPMPPSFAPPAYGDDKSPANGSSICCVLEYKGASVLLAGDAHATSLAKSLPRLAKQRSVERLRFDAIKLPHHGSMSNISKGWLQWVDCDRWLISTNGAVFQHPDLETAQLVTSVYAKLHAGSDLKPSLLCNYENIAEQLANKAKGRWTTIPPEGDQAGPVGGLLLSLPAGA